MEFIKDAVCYDCVEKPDDFYQSAIAFGNFQKMLSDYPAETLYETIEGFHDTKRRFAAFKESSVSSSNLFKSSFASFDNFLYPYKTSPSFVKK